ncbi:MAG: hypothetical protein R3B09_16625 [Nannocystaceae bacterium]
MPRWFNVAGPCSPADHYMLSVSRRIPQVRRLVERKAYFVVHAPRQVGKTTSLLALARELTAEGRFTSVLLSLEVGAAFPEDTGAAELAILDAWRGATRARLPDELQPPPWPESTPGRRIGAALQAWSRASTRPLVLFLDEIDALSGEVLISVLRQLRDGYEARAADFPWSLALIGLRDRAFELTQGQPWLVNALAKEAVDELLPDPSEPVTVAVIEAAKEELIRRQDTHLDSLAERLREDRVRRIIEPILAGEALPPVLADDLLYVQDLGLVRSSASGGLVVANPIYREVIPRSLATVPIASLPQIQPTWLTADGRLDRERLLGAFLAFWRQHGEPIMGSAPYHEIAPHLVLMAFLHRVVNGGGSIEREYAIGSGRMDLLVRYGDQRLAIELKVWRDGERDPRSEGLVQLDRYLAGLGLEVGWLVIFDRRSGLSRVAERTSAEVAVTPGGRSVTVVRA